MIDAQLALVTEAGLPGEVAAAIAAMDGSETGVVGGYRVYARPDLPAVEPDPVAARLGARDPARAARWAGRGVRGPAGARFKTAGGVVQAVGAASHRSAGGADRAAAAHGRSRCRVR